MKAKYLSAKLFLLLFSLLTGCTTEFAQVDKDGKPKLIVGIVVDQMRADYLDRFAGNFGTGGFNKLIREGYNNKNVHYNYIPTATAPGHASVFTGTIPSNHGIISNHWFSRGLNRMTYSLEDSIYKNVTSNGIVETPKQSSGISPGRSPKRLLCSTITDELKRSMNYKSKVIGLSLKDRGAILPAGHLADYALWYDNETGEFITSSYYLSKLPKWLDTFNARHLADSLLELTWDPLFAIENYNQSGEDHSPFERKFIGKESSTFPYDLLELRKTNGEYDLLPHTPFGNTLLTELAMEAIRSENLGQHESPDFLTISYSSTDKIGHDFGIRSKELEDTYARLDRDLARLLNYLDDEVGKDKYLLFLTSDHGASDSPAYLKTINMPGKFYDPFEIKEKLNECLRDKYKRRDLVLYADKTQLYLDPEVLAVKDIEQTITSCLKNVEGLKKLTFSKDVGLNNISRSISAFVENSYYQQRSGDVYMHFEPGWLARRKYGTSHGTGYNYDTHVPLLWYGWRIHGGESFTPYPITSIAPTLAMLLNVPLANCSSHQSITFGQ